MQHLRRQHGRQGECDHPGHDHCAGEGEGKFRKQRANEPGHEADGRIDRNQGGRHRDDRHADLAGRVDGGVKPGLPHLDVPVHVLDDNDRVVDHETDGQNHRQQRQEVHRESHQQHQEAAADERQRHGQSRHDRCAHRPERQVDHEQNDEQCLGEGFEDFLDRILDVLAGVITDPRGHDGGELPLDLLHLIPDAAGDRQRVGAGRGFDRNHRAGRAVEQGDGIVALGAQFDARDILEPDERAVVAAHDETAKILHGRDVRGCRQVGQHVGALDLPGRREEVVGIQHGGNFAR